MTLLLLTTLDSHYYPMIITLKVVKLVMGFDMSSVLKAGGSAVNSVSIRVSNLLRTGSTPFVEHK